MTRIGIDLGGTKIEVIALAADGRELLRHRVPTPKGDYHGTVAAIVDLVRVAESEAGVRCPVGIGTPGAISTRTGRIKKFEQPTPSRSTAARRSRTIARP